MTQLNNTPLEFRVGDSSNYFKIDNGGVVTFVGSAVRKLTLRPNLNAGLQGRAGSPTATVRGAFSCYEMPLWDAGANVNKELYFRERIPFRWDGTSNINFKLIATLSGSEDVGDKFNFQLSWYNANITGSLTSTVVSTTTEVTVLAGRNGTGNTYSVPFVIDWDEHTPNVAPRDYLAGRVRRVAASANEVTNNPHICDWITEYQVDRIFGSF